MGFNALKALSTRNDDPQGASRPFDGSRDGFVLGEGAGALFVEELEHAKARGARIYAELLGVGMSGDAHHITAPDPNGLGARNAMLASIRDAGIEATDVDYLICMAHLQDSEILPRRMPLRASLVITPTR